MKSATVETPVAPPNGEIVPLESVLCTEQLNKRARRPPDYAAESRALTALVTALADSPQNILQTLSEKILEVLRVGSAGVSVLTREDGGKRFYWPAIAGIWKPHIGGGTPRDFGPCGDALDRNTPLLFHHLERRYTYFLTVKPPVEECLLVPFYVEGKAVGTIWAIAHDKRRKFDAEDLRMLESLGPVASAGYQAVERLDALRQHDHALRQNRTDLSRRVAELQKANAQARESRRAALNLMEDSVQSQRTTEKLNADLHESEERFRMVADNMSPLAWTCNQLGNVTWYNQRWLDYTGLTFEEMKDWGWTKCHHPDHVERVVQSVQRSRESGQIWEETFPLRGKDGNYRWFLSRALPIRDAEGKIVRWFGTNTDVTEQRAAEEALRQAHEMLTSEATHLEILVQERTARLQETIGELEHFSYTITHDMRAPLRAMQGYSEMLLEQNRDQLQPHSADYLRRIKEAARRMDALIRDSLQYAKVVREKIPLGVVRPEPVLRGILESYPALQSHHVEIQVVEPLLPVIANEAGLGQCFSNLLANAAKFVKAGKIPHIRIWAEARQQSRNPKIRQSSDAGTVRFWFEDNGIGIPREYQDRIFGMFQQLDKSYEGTGIGLALVRKTAERMEGRVGVESEPGKGSRFWLEFKKAPDERPTQKSVNPSISE